MTGRDEFADDRDEDRDDSARSGHHGADGNGWTKSVLAFDDALIDPDLLDHLLPLDGRWPEPRLLDQVDVFYLRDRTRVDPQIFDAETAGWLLNELHTDLPDWHAAAVFDEESTTGSAARDAFAALGVRPVRGLDPQVWLASTVLVRFLRGVAG